MLLTESEVAERLRCSRTKIKRLRLSGKLAYIPGRPVLIRESDLNDYLESVTCRPRPSASQTTGTSTPTGQKDAAADARAWAQKTVLLRRRGSASGSCSAATGAARRKKTAARR